MTRRRLTSIQRLSLFDKHGGRCHLCKGKITVREKWDLDHVIPLAIGGADDLANLAPAHDTCHRTKTATVDVPAIAKGTRIRSARFTSSRPSCAWRIKVPGAAFTFVPPPLSFTG